MRIISILLLLVIEVSSKAQVGINSDSSLPDNSAILDLKSSSKGMLLPRMTESDRLAISLPATGLMVYQTDNSTGLYYNTGTPAAPTWTLLKLNGTLNYLVKFDGTANGGNSLIYDNGTNIGIGIATPASRLHVRGAGNTNSTSALRVDNTSGRTSMFINDIGNVGIGTVIPLAAGGFGSVGSLVNKRGLTIASMLTYTPDAPAVLELFGSTDAVNEETGMLEFIVRHSTETIYNVARIAAVRDNAFNPFTALAFYTRPDATMPERMRISSNGNVGINCSSPNYKLHVVGDITAQGGTLRAASATVSTMITACSDIRYKKDIQPLENILPQLLNIQGVTYRFKKDEFPERSFPGTKQIGFIAQEVEKYFPEVVQTDNDGYKSIDYSRFAPLFLSAIKEHHEIINRQEKEINILRANEKNTIEELKKMQEEIKALRKEMSLK